MDNQELLTKLNANAKSKEDALREQKEQYLRECQEKQLKVQKDIDAFDQFLYDGVEQFLIDAVSKGDFKNVNGKRIVEGTIYFSRFEEDIGYYSERRKVGIETANNHKVLITEESKIPNCDLIDFGYRCFFQSTHTSTFTYTKGLFKKKTITEKGRDYKLPNDKAIAAFKNFFNTKSNGVIRIIDYEYHEGHTYRTNSENCTFSFIAEF